MNRSPKKASVRAPSPGAPHDDRLVAGRVPAGRDDRDLRHDLVLAVDPALLAPGLDEPQLRLDVRRDEPRVVAERDLPLGLLGDDLGVRERLRAVGPQQAAGVVEMEVAHRDDVDALGREPGGLERGDDPRAFVGAHRPGLVVDPVADPRLDQHATRARLDQQAVERLEQPALVVDLVLDEAAPQDPRHRPEQRPGVGAERAGLDERDPNAATEVARPVDRVVHRHRLTPAR